MMENTLVSVKRVENYSPELLRKAIEFHFSELGVDNELVPGMRVLIKPNLLSARKPEHCATTHPAIISALVYYLNNKGISDITLADSPGGPYTVAGLSAVYSACGYKQIEGIKLNYDTGYREVGNKIKGNSGIASFNIINPIADADFIINVAKLKTHSLTGMSGGVKNLFGSIPGLQKPEMHYRCPNHDTFGKMLIDLAETVAPEVTLIDGIVGMEGNGPNMGTPKECGYLLASRNPFYCDLVAAKIIGIKPETTVPLGFALETKKVESDKLRLVGDEPVNMKFRLPDSSDENYLNGLPSFTRGIVGFFAGKFLKPVPNITNDNCIGCGKCAESCPEKIIEIKNRKAKITDRSKCISCFCCQEMCPNHAIKVKRRLI